jgi:hypothetical protein
MSKLILKNPLKDVADVNRINRNKNFGTNQSRQFDLADIVLHVPIKSIVEHYGKANVDVVVQTCISKPYNDFYGHGFKKRYKAKYSTTIPYDMAEALYGDLSVTSFAVPVK